MGWLDENTGKRFTFFADPDGLPLELYERSVEIKEPGGQRSVRW